jgi:pimeloyl-ACP methyl ester carboxylesterase
MPPPESLAELPPPVQDAAAQARGAPCGVAAEGRAGDGRRAGSEEFLRNYTPKRWAGVNIAALRAAWLLPQVDSSRTLVLGASEGGQIAARVAAHLPEVTHVAVLACGGATQLFDALIR